MNNIFNGMMGKIAHGMCRLSMNGGIAVKTSSDYKSYDIKNNRLVNCTNFVFDIGEEFFFVIPTNKVERGDIILVGGKPKCVVSVDKGTIQVINYEDSTVENILPERHIFMGNTYFYGKIISMFGDNLNLKGDKGMKKLMSYMMMSEMMKGNNGNGSMNPMAMMMFMGGGIDTNFGGMFDFLDDNNKITEEIEDGITEG